jgi:hypothetical protein
VRPRAGPDRDTLRRVVFQLQHPGWRITSPLTGSSDDGQWHATNGTTDLSAGSLAALLDHLEWHHATRTLHRLVRTSGPAGR